MGIGFGVGVMSVKAGRDFAAGMVRSEEPARVSEPKTIDRPNFRFEHAGNWTIDTADEDYDPDHSFSVESPGQSFMMFQIADGVLDLKDLVENHATIQTSKVIKQATRTPLTRWGTYEGEGVLLKGRHLGITPGTIRIFAFHRGEQTYTVIESTYDEDRASVEPGFDLVARSFRVKDAK